MDFRDPQPYPPNMMMVDPNSYPNTFTPSMIMTPNTARFPLTSNNLSPHFDPYNNNNNNNNNNSGINNESMKPCVVATESLKRKRGRPRKLSPPDVDTSLALVSTHVLPSSSSSVKGMGRPHNSEKKQLSALGSPVATKFTPYALFVEPGADVAAKIMAFYEQARRAITIFSANGKVGNVTLRHTTGVEGVVTYEGLYELISMSGFSPLVENNNDRTRMRELNVTLGGFGGIVIGGRVVGNLTAVSTVQVVVGSFLVEGTKTISKNLNLEPSFASSSSHILTLGASMMPTNSTSQGRSIESSNDNDTFSDRSGF